MKAIEQYFPMVLYYSILKNENYHIYPVLNSTILGLSLELERSKKIAMKSVQFQTLSKTAYFNYQLRSVWDL